MTVKSRQFLMREITRECGLPDNRLQLKNGTDLVLRLQPDDQYERVDCMLAKFKGRSVRLGFVGNEQYVGNAQ